MRAECPAAKTDHRFDFTDECMVYRYEKLDDLEE